MKDGFLKVCTASPTVTLGDIGATLKECVSLANEATLGGGGVILFPQLTLTSATLGDLYFQSVITDAAMRALGEYADLTRELDIISVIGLPVRRAGNLYSCMAVVSSGRVLALIPKRISDGVFSSGVGVSDSITALGYEIPFGCDLLIDLAYPEGASLTVAFADEVLSCESTLADAVKAGVGLVLCPDASPVSCLGSAPRAQLLLAESRRLSIALAYSCTSLGESGTDALYSGDRLICECGERLCGGDALSGVKLSSSEVDFEIIYGKRPRSVTPPRISYTRIGVNNRKQDVVLTRKYPKLPYVGEGDTEALLRTVKIQANALAGRVQRSHSRTMVIGISGGLDSTLALIAAVEACDVLGISRDSVIALTMPCFGTSKKTRGNAELLCEALGVTLKTVDIRNAVLGHLSDIGHDTVTPDATFENAQARERTQILMDTANMCGGIVVGTGDLSELALGFCTYNGDHMSMYSVNASLPKTLMRRIVGEYAERIKSVNEPAYRVLTDILETPISPELLPPDKAGDIAQCTEDIVGPYALHDFFIYYFIKYGFSPRKLLRIARDSFADEYTEDEIKRTLIVFVRRFFSSQFKRSCAPDGPAVTEISFSPRAGAGFSMPSDALCAEWLRELED
ncbi:MAG: NAD(+) synthase [Clostridia bacterium]|nr:NAD(+) synthase [Clostridia bacterium]